MSAAIDFTTTPARGEARASRATGPRSGALPAGRIIHRSLSMLATALLVLAGVAFMTLVIGPRVLGYQTSTMLTGSMAPLINPGDIVVTKPVPASDIRVGDIITYHIPVEDQRVETHRVTEVNTNPEGSITVQTKGDANNGVDPWLATLTGATVDRHTLTVPYVGTAIRAMREPIVLNTLIYGAPAVLVIGMLASIWGRKPEPEAPHEAPAEEAHV
ncbi:signal peptidase I [Pseudarthrobacter sp. YS3]|uniref:signal peptidase I n=1 Tax=Pseudarthrobacter sp. YS3 TaxID=3453718 RepID=UPI003EEAF05D